MKRKDIFLIFMFLYFGNVLLWGQAHSYEVYDDDYYKLEVVIEHDTIYVQDTMYVSHLDDVTRIFNMSFDEYSKQLLDSVKQHDTTQIRSLERLYLNYLLPMYYPGYIEHRYIVRNYSLETKDNYLKMDINSLRRPLFTLQDSLKLDVMLVCRGDVNTDNFLKSDYYRSSCLEQLFLSINNTKWTKIDGINLYFPDFTFKEKRAMAQFVKSASLIIDSCHIKSINNLKLYVTFDKENEENHHAYLCGLAQMADSIFLVDSKIASWPREPISTIVKTDAAKVSWWSKVFNQFTLARFNLASFPQIDKEEELSPQNLRLLINSDYPYNNWEIYFFVLIGIGIAIIVVSILYWKIPRFSYLLNNNIAYCFSLIIMLMLEVYILFVCMVEAMSNEDVFTFGGEDKNTLLLLPLLFVFVIPMLNMINKGKEKP